MAIGSPMMWLSVVWLVAAIALLAVGAHVRRTRRGLGLGLMAAGVLVTLLPVSAVAYELTWGSKQSTIWVEGFEPAKDPGLTVELRHNRDFRDGIEYHFGNAGGPEHVTGVFQEQHPGGVVTLSGTAGDDDSIWHLSTDAARYDLTYWSEADWYGLTLQVVVLYSAARGEDLRIPFPRSALGATSLTEGQQYINPWSTDQWRDFYADITSAQIVGDSITVTSAQGPTATIALGDGVATITIND